jgi:hypothetical protein
MLKRLFIILLLAVPAWGQADELSLRLPSGVEFSSQRIASDPGKPGPLLLWLGTAPAEAELSAAADLARRGIETWFTDLYAPWFLPALPSSPGLVPGTDLADWLDAVQARNPGREWLLVSMGRLAEPALRGLQAWQQRHREAGPGRVLLLFPMLYRNVEAGAEPDYAAVVDQTRARIAILQPKSSAGYWWRERLKARLEAAGSQVFLTVQPGLRDGYYRRGDITEFEQAAAARLAATLLDAIQPLLAEDPK